MSEASFDESIVNESCAKAPLNPRWAFKLGVIAAVVLGVGVWGYFDAAVIYPKRGVKYADWAKWQYLDQAQKADREDFGIFLRDSSVQNPIEELARLREPERILQNQQDAGNPSSSRSLRASMQVARMRWLEALKVVGMLDAKHTIIDSPQRTLDELADAWGSSQGNPKPLSAFDLLVQWMIMGVCFLVTLVMVVHMIRVRAKRYAWDAGSMTLTLPGGERITPDDLDEVDKRKWDKFIVFLKIKGAHSELGGQEVSVDTYQHQRVEDWLLAMEAKAFPSQEQRDPLLEGEPSAVQGADGDALDALNAVNGGGDSDASESDEN